MSGCCESLEFQRRSNPPGADIGHAEGVEFTLGSCRSCKRILIHCWVAGGYAEGYEVVDQAFVDRLSGPTNPGARKQLLADWWNSVA